MDAPSTAPDFERTAPGREAPEDHHDDPTDRIVLGVAGYVADGLGVDALWVRMAFVVLALVGGVGIMAYLALWLIVFGPDRTGLPFVRYIGGAVAIVGIPLVIAGADLEFASGPVAVVALLVGLMLALWQPRRVPPARTSSTSSRAFPPPVYENYSSPGTHLVVEPSSIEGILESSEHDPGIEGDPARSPRHTRPRRTRRARREPSILGRLTFGLAVIVAAVGALIDLVNGGRLHPEQWLGAAALVCGIGLLIGALRGRAWWLIVPALLFAGTGYITGVMARIGLDADDAFGETYVYVDQSVSQRPRCRKHRRHDEP